MEPPREIINKEMEAMNGFICADGLLDVMEQSGVTETIVMPFLCGKCSCVHLTIQCEAGVELHLTLPQDAADKLANGLMAPSALHRDLLEDGNARS